MANRAPDPIIGDNEENAAHVVAVDNLTITEAFDSSDAFRGLLTRLSFPNNAITRLISHEGLSSARDLSRTRPKQLSDSLESVNKLFGAQRVVASRIYFSHGRIMRLKALSSFFRRCMVANRIPDVRIIGPSQVDSYEDHLDVWSKKADNVQDAISNNSIKFDPSNFIKFRQTIETMCSSILGNRGVTLEYLIRTEDNNPLQPIEEAVPDVNSIEFMRDNTTLRGTDYKVDNGNLFVILRHYLTSTPGWNVIAKYTNENDGRKAFKSLRAHYEGASYFDLMKTKANSMMMKTFYRGDTHKFSWEKFVALHLEAHRMFDDIGEALPESLKILYFKGGIRPEAGLESSMEVAKGLPNVGTSFELFVNHMTESVTNKRSRAEVLKISQPRHVAGSSATGRGRGRAPGRGGRFGGRSSRGERGGRSFRGRGRLVRRSMNYGGLSSPDTNIPETIVVEGKTLYPRRVYQKSEYDQLSYSQKGELSKARKNVSSFNTDGNSTSDIRNIRSAVTDGIRGLLDRSSSDNTSSDNQRNDNPTDGNSVADQFKRRRHNPN